MISPAFPSSRLTVVACALLLLWGAPRNAQSASSGSARAAEASISIRARVHEVPADVAVQAYVRPEGQILTVLVRVPFESMRDLDVPLRPGGPFLALEDPALARGVRDGARIWIADYLDFYEGGQLVGPVEVVTARLSLPSDRSFTSFDGALAHIRREDPLPPGTELPPGQALLDVLLEVPIRDASSDFAVEPGLEHLGVETRSVVHFLPPGGGERVFTYTGDPGRLQLDPSWLQAGLRFLELGFMHILGGLDHLLFLLCLVLPYRRIRGLVPVVTAFTLAHSITLSAAALGMAPTALWFPPLVESLIALSIVWMGLENILGIRLSRRWLVAFLFGLVHGFGFSFLLTESLQLAGSQLVASLVAFNVGVELGQLAVLVVLVPILVGVVRLGLPERPAVIVASALVVHQAWHWMTDRGGAFLAYDLRMPTMDVGLAVAAMRWGALLLLCTGIAWALSGWSRRWSEDGPVTGARPTPP